MANFPLCNQNNPVGAHSRYFVKRVDAVGKKAYMYFASEKPGRGIVNNDARAVAYGTKEGKCTLGITPQEKLNSVGDAEPVGIDENCGFEAQVLKYCIEDRGKRGNNPLSPKPGFNPTKGPFKWRDQVIAEAAAKNCEVIIQAEMTNHQPPADGQDATLPPLREVSNIIFAADQARFKVGSSFIGFNRVFVDRKAGRDQMTITNMDPWRHLFPDPFGAPSLKFLSQRENYGRLLRRILPNMFFCSCDSTNEWCSKIASQSDPETNNIITAIIAAAK